MNQGFQIFPHVFEQADIDAVLNTLSEPTVARSRAGARNVFNLTAVRRLSQQPALLTIAAQFIGPTATPFRATLFDKSGRSNWLVPWHQDTMLPLRERFESAEWGPWSIKAGVLHARAPAAALAKVVALRIHLDDSNGPLRVLPGTHRHGVLSSEGIAELARTTEPVDCVAPAGAVVAMRPLVIHASSKARNPNPRRVLHIEYAESLAVAPEAELAAG